MAGRPNMARPWLTSSWPHSTVITSQSHSARGEGRTPKANSVMHAVSESSWSIKRQSMDVANGRYVELLLCRQCNEYRNGDGCVSDSRHHTHTETTNWQIISGNPTTYAYDWINTCNATITAQKHYWLLQHVDSRFESIRTDSINKWIRFVKQSDSSPRQLFFGLFDYLLFQFLFRK